MKVASVPAYGLSSESNPALIFAASVNDPQVFSPSPCARLLELDTAGDIAIDRAQRPRFSTLEQDTASGGKMALPMGHHLGDLSHLGRLRLPPAGHPAGFLSADAGSSGV